MMYRLSPLQMPSVGLRGLVQPPPEGASPPCQHAEVFERPLSTACRERARPLEKPPSAGSWERAQPLERPPSAGCRECAPLCSEPSFPCTSLWGRSPHSLLRKVFRFCFFSEFNNLLLPLILFWLFAHFCSSFLCFCFSTFFSSSYLEYLCEDFKFSSECCVTVFFSFVAFLLEGDGFVSGDAFISSF